MLLVWSTRCSGAAASTIAQYHMRRSTCQKLNAGSNLTPCPLLHSVCSCLLPTNCMTSKCEDESNLCGRTVCFPSNNLNDRVTIGFI